ncbi:tyrosine-protein phosphatase [Solibacillus silvestris]|uniref:tyrosine-protein phosphatase n=1 Tax=Solibacillus silvestris TaxID=76853 RepID=UPI003F7F2154
MVDMHCHLLWNVDDGPRSMEESMKLFEQAVKEGITTIIATSHSNHPKYDAKYEEVTNQVTILQNELINNNIPLTLYTGHEVRLSENIVPRYQNKQIHTLANSQYVLLELPNNTVPIYTKHIIHSLLLEGITPIIAHPERNKAIAEKPDRLAELIRQGAYSQITAGSLTGHFGRTVQKLSLDLIRANLVHMYGSDAHNTTTRSFHFEEGLRYLEKRKQLEAVDTFLENNARILQNKTFLIKEPEEVETVKWWKIY